jgi:hypothetical protein
MNFWEWALNVAGSSAKRPSFDVSHTVLCAALAAAMSPGEGDDDTDVLNGGAGGIRTRASY